MENNLIALFDMDDTLFDYRNSLQKELTKLRSPNEKEIDFYNEISPKYLKERVKLITSQESFWSEMPKLKSGWDILEVVKSLHYDIMILTQGPMKKPAAWSGKKKCIDKHLGESFGITLTRNKSLVYGKVLVDDYPPYVENWLKWRKNGRVIMPAHDFNEGFEHPQVIRYDGNNLDEVREVLEEVKRRNFEK